MKASGPVALRRKPDERNIECRAKAILSADFLKLGLEALITANTDCSVAIV